MLAERAARLVLGVCCLVFGFVLVLHVAILPEAMWQGDEYGYFAQWHLHGLSFVIDRIWQWSPRPFSELLIFAYGLAVDASRAPHIGLALGAIWTLSALIAFAPFVTTQSKAWRPRLFLSACITMLFLLGHPVADLMYWPMAAFAHMPVLAAATALTLMAVGGDASPRWEAFLLTIAAFSSEIGLFVAVSYLLGRCLMARRGMSRVLFVPALACSFVLWRLVAGRLALPHDHATQTHGRALASLIAAWTPFWRNLAMLQSSETSVGDALGGSVRDGLVLKLLLTASFIALVRVAGWRSHPRQIAVIAFALIATNFATIAAANYEFGFLCCQRQETMRLDFSLLLALLAGAAIGASRPPLLRSSRPLWATGAALGLLLYVGETARWRAADMILAIRSRALEERAHQATWLSGVGTGTVMTMTQGTNSHLFYYWPWKPGVYHLVGPGWEVQSQFVMGYFGKRELIVLPPQAIEP